jgi:hypothetical protein
MSKILWHVPVRANSVARSSAVRFLRMIEKCLAKARVPPLGAGGEANALIKLSNLRNCGRHDLVQKYKMTHKRKLRASSKVRRVLLLLLLVVAILIVPALIPRAHAITEAWETINYTFPWNF